MKTRITELLALNIRSFRAVWHGWQRAIWHRQYLRQRPGLIGGANAPAEVIRNYIREVKAVTTSHLA